MMNIEIELHAYKDESPSQYADRLGIFYTSKVSDEHKKKLGQFFTPVAISKFMSEFAIVNKEKIKILDPGCGIGILSIALAEVIAEKNGFVKTIDLVAFESDVEILSLAEKSFDYLAIWLQKKGINFTYFLCKNDFILHNSHILNDKKNINESYDLVISNPPYFKLSKKDNRAKAAEAVIFGQPNIYTIFLLISVKLVNSTGQLIFITPRSFCSGSYFRLFREIFFSSINIQRIHLFNSRKDAFKRDNVLQENIIINAFTKNNIKENQLEMPLQIDHEIIISNSIGLEDISICRKKKYFWKDLIELNSFQKILHLPSTDRDENVIKLFKTWKGSLGLYDLNISTGRVVSFRNEDFISEKNSKNTVPLIWMHNVEPMKFNWPLNKIYKGKIKNQYIINSKNSESKLIENRNYVLLRRFSSKDDSKRLIAAPYFQKYILNKDFIGVENHLNYIYHKNRNLDDIEIFGIAAILNSKLFDIYFRTFNGNINVSATELRDFPLPDYELIKLLGKTIVENNKNKVKYEIDSLLLKVFNLSIEL